MIIDDDTKILDVLNTLPVGWSLAISWSDEDASAWVQVLQAEKNTEHMVNAFALQDALVEALAFVGVVQGRWDREEQDRIDKENYEDAKAFDAYELRREAGWR